MVAEEEGGGGEMLCEVVAHGGSTVFRNSQTILDSADKKNENILFYFSNCILSVYKRHTFPTLRLGAMPALP